MEGFGTIPRIFFAHDERGGRTLLQSRDFPGCESRISKSTGKQSLMQKCSDGDEHFSEHFFQSNCKYPKDFRVVQSVHTIELYHFDTGSLASHHLPANIYGFSGGKKTSSFFPATMEQNIARVNLFCKPSISFYLMAATQSLPFIGNVLFL